MAITGPPTSGKTQLSIAVAEALAGDCDHDIEFAALVLHPAARREQQVPWRSRQGPADQMIEPREAQRDPDQADGHEQPTPFRTTWCGVSWPAWLGHGISESVIADRSNGASASAIS